MVVAARIARLAASLCIMLSSISTSSFAQTAGQGGKVSPPSGRIGVPRSGRVVTPRAGRFTQRPSGRLVSPRRTIVTPRVQSQGNRRIQRVIRPRAITPLAPKARTPAFRSAGRTIRKPPANLALLNSGLRSNPGRIKPVHIQHDPNHKAGKSGWMHRHRPFFFKHAGHRWHRYYYSFLAGGLWYWYWYDVIADSDPAVILYDDAVLPDCDPEIDECIEPETLADPAIPEAGSAEEAMSRCAAAFRSFNAETGTYVTYRGEVRRCPYL